MSTHPATQHSLVVMRDQGRELIENGAITPGYDANVTAVLGMLNEALATELVCVLRYRRHYFSAQGFLAEAIKAEFLAHSQEELSHADLIAARIVQLGGIPDFNPESLTERSHADFGSANSLLDMVREDLVAERIAIDTYRSMIHYLQKHDSTTRRLLEQILAVEEEHAEDLASMLMNARDDLQEQE